MDNGYLRGAVALSHFFLAGRVEPGDAVADLTCGNGKDTLFLARLVGEPGKVWAFDIQEDALANTRRLLEESSCPEQVEIVAAGHERLSEFITGPLKAAVFNLGYLPGGDRKVATRPDRTLSALEQAALLLLPGGLITVCVYTGHEGGDDEGEAVEKWASGLPGEEYNVWVCRQPNRSSAAPYLLFVEKRRP